jgi:hypothetical protein
MKAIDIILFIVPLKIYKTLELFIDNLYINNFVFMSILHKKNPSLLSL